MRENRIVTIAGAGIWGCTVARVLADAGFAVRVLEKRGAVGGNVRCETDAKTGIEVHLYGSHIFHTDSDEVWSFVRRFTAFNGYQHKVLARHGGKMYFLPVGLALLNRFFGVDLVPGEVEAFMRDEAHARAVFDAFFRNYTSKQWGRAPEEIDPSIIKRVPARASWDINYFRDWRQGIPLDGYNALFAKMLDHPAISVETDHAWTLAEKAPGETVFYSGPIDALFGYRFGALPWRSLRFDVSRRAVKDAQGTSVVNYVDADVPFTRIHEYKHYHPERTAVMETGETILCTEYPKAWEPGDEPYYPVASPDSAALYARYAAEAAKTPDLVVGGRLGGFRYLDMDKSIADALACARRWLNHKEVR